MNLNIFRLFQRWKQKGANTKKDAPEVSSTATPIPAGPREEMEKTGPATDVLEQSLMNSAGLAGSAGGARARWIGPEMSVTVAGRNIGGMIYLAPERRQSAWDQMSRPVIDPSLPVDGVGGEFSGESMSYWPSYARIGPRARTTYLDWLASGRSDKRYSVGYVFLYFYGLERRFFVDRPDEGEKELLIAEVERLLGVYGDNRSVKGYLGTFLDAAQATAGYEDRTEPRIEKAGYELPLSPNPPKR